MKLYILQHKLTFICITFILNFLSRVQLFPPLMSYYHQNNVDQIG